MGKDTLKMTQISGEDIFQEISHIGVPPKKPEKKNKQKILSTKLNKFASDDLNPIF